MFRPEGAVAPVRAPPARPEPPQMVVAPAVLMALDLRPGESVARIWRAGYVLPDRSSEGEASTPMASGILVTTNQRLIFVHEKGVINKSYKLMDAMELHQITGQHITSLLRLKELEVEVQDQQALRKQRFSNLHEIDPFTLKPVPPSTPEEATDYFEKLIARSPKGL
jgi:hypothetical protein